jgi:hypothetical protein
MAINILCRAVLITKIRAGKPCFIFANRLLNIWLQISTYLILVTYLLRHLHQERVEDVVGGGVVDVDVDCLLQEDFLLVLQLSESSKLVPPYLLALR